MLNTIGYRNVINSHAIRKICVRLYVNCFSTELYNPPLLSKPVHSIIIDDTLLSQTFHLVAQILQYFVFKSNQRA